MKIQPSEYMPAALSLAAWCAVGAGVGALVLSGRVIQDITFIAQNISFARAACIGAGTGGLAFLVLMIGQDLSHSLTNKSEQDFWKHFSWIAVLPVLAVPYLAGVSVVTGATLVAIVALTTLAKYAAVGII
jgi:hypothetical protein